MGSQEDLSCSDGNILDRVECILTYGGSATTDVVLNYIAIALNLIHCGFLIVAQTQKVNKEDHLKRQAFVSLLFVILFQIGLCLALGCSGVSVIWCAMFGWTIATKTRVKTRIVGGNNLFLFNKGLIVYYLFTKPFITTVAHICAVVLGVILAQLGSVKALFNEIMLVNKEIETRKEQTRQKSQNRVSKLVNEQTKKCIE